MQGKWVDEWRARVERETVVAVRVVAMRAGDASAVARTRPSWPCGQAAPRR